MSLPNSLRIYSELGDDSRLLVGRGCGHMLPMEIPDQVNDALADLVDRARLAENRPKLPWLWGRNGKQ